MAPSLAPSGRGGQELTGCRARVRGGRRALGLNPAPLASWPLSEPQFPHLGGKMLFIPKGFFCFFLFFLITYLFLAALGLCCCARAFYSCGERGLLFVAVHGLLIAVASLVVEHGL